MKKILFALDGNHFSKGAFDFILQINAKSSVQVVGVFLPSFIDRTVWAIPSRDELFFAQELLDEEDQIIQQNMQHFSDCCNEHKLAYSLHKPENYSAIKDLQLESRYADLLIIGHQTYYSKSNLSYVNNELRDTVRHVECPVLLVPERYNFPDNIVVAYDGSAASVHAIKMFSYIFPELKHLSVAICYADAKSDNIPNLEHIKELAKSHFSNITYTNLKLDPEKYFATWMATYSSSILVAGALSRSGLSEFFHESFVVGILEQCSIPVFIAHK